MGQTLYGRRLRVTLAVPVSTPGDFANVTTDVIEINGGEGGGLAPGLRCSFEVHANAEKDPNTSKLVVTNLSPTTRGSLQKKGVKVTIEAGYQATGLSRIFVGDARSIDHVRNGADWDTTIKLGDGERSIRYARFSESFAPGTPAGTVLEALANATGLAIGNVPTIVANLTTFDQGYVVHGPVSRSLDALVKSLGYTWSVQAGALQVTLPGQSVVAAIPQVDSSSGLVDSPEMGVPEKKGKPQLVKYKSLLRPSRPGSKEKLVSERYNGLVVVKKVTMTGDTHGLDWYTECEGVISQ